jgi:hypothetical protein
MAGSARASILGMHRQEHRREPLQFRFRFSWVKHVIGPADYRGALECLSLMTASPYSTLASHRVCHTQAALYTFLPSHTTTKWAIVPVDVKQQQRLYHFFAFACICTQTHRLTLSLSLSHCWTALSLHITCMIHSIQVTIYRSARVLCSCVTRFLSLPPHVTQFYETVINPPLVLWRRVQLTTSQRRFEDTGESRPLRK